MRITEKELIVYGPQLEEIARHAVVPDTVTGQRVVPRSTGPSRMRAGGRCSCGSGSPNWGSRRRRFLEGLLQVQRYGKDQAQRVLALLGTYARADLIAVLERAIRYGAYSHAAVERILSAQTRPRTILDVLAEEETVADPALAG